jgi:hypothetical protein
VTKHHLTRVRRATLVLLALAVVGAACGDDESSTDSSSTTSTSAASASTGTATIDAFDVPATTACAGATSVTVQASYATTGAVRWQLLVDGRELPGTDAPTATLDVPLHCDPLPHSFVLVAYDAAGAKTVKELNVGTEL